jgi:hypothetical protein
MREARGDVSAAREPYVPLDRPTLGPTSSRRRDLLDTIFHGFVNLLVEVVVLTLAFIFFLSREEERAVTRLVEDVSYERLRDVYSRILQRQYNDICKTPGVCVASGVASGDGQGAFPPLAAAAAALGTVLRAAKAPDADESGTAVQNKWALRVSIVLMAMALVVFFTAYATNRLAGGPTVNLHRIVAYNVVLLVVALGLQVAFMASITLRYAPSLPSSQYRAFRERVKVRIAEARQQKAGETDGWTPSEAKGSGWTPSEAKGSQYAPLDEGLVTADAAASTGYLTAIVLGIAIIIYLAWRTRAYQRVTFLQSLCVQTLFIGAVVVGMYFLLKATVTPKVETRVMDDMAKQVVSRMVLADDDGAAAEAELDAALAAGLVDLDRTDAGTLARNAELMRTLRVVLAIAAAALVALIVLLRLARVARNRRRGLPSGSTGGFLAALLLVGLVGGSTSLLVEFGFGNYVLANFVPANASRIFNDTLENVAQSAEEHARWYTRAGCAFTQIVVGTEDYYTDPALACCRELGPEPPAGDGPRPPCSDASVWRRRVRNTRLTAEL